MKLLLNDKVTTYLKISMLFISILNWEYLKGENTSVVQVVPVSPTAAFASLLPHVRYNRLPYRFRTRVPNGVGIKELSLWKLPNVLPAKPV